MSSIIKVNDKWRAQVRRRGMKPRTKTFPTKVLAQRWANEVENAHEFKRATPADPLQTTVGELITRYTDEIAGSKPFGRNKADVLAKLEKHLGDEVASELTVERIVQYVRKDRRIAGVTASIDLTYLKGVLRIARALWRDPVQPSVIDDAREILKYMGQLDRSKERDRRPTPDELAALRRWFERSDSLTPDIFDFILASCFRPPSEITRLRWADLSDVDRTIVIHDRKDPRKKIGNHQTVPLLNGSYEIVRRQRRRDALIFPVNGKSWSSLFPRACRAAGIEDLHLYDLRHEAISRLVETRKYSIPEMMLVTGHKDPKQLMRYTQLHARDLHR